MYFNNKILVGKSDKKELSILLDKANRHGLITGASGSGKTITSKVMADLFDAGASMDVVKKWFVESFESYRKVQEVFY